MRTHHKPTEPITQQLLHVLLTPWQSSLHLFKKQMNVLYYRRNLRCDLHKTKPSAIGNRGQLYGEDGLTHAAAAAGDIL